MSFPLTKTDTVALVTCQDVAALQHLRGESDWIVVPNCHKALVPKELWRKAQAIREARKQKGANTGFRRGRGLVSPYLLSGLVECSGCGHKFHGHKITKGKRKKNGEKVVTNYYVCGGYMMAGNSICRRDLILQRDPGRGEEPEGKG